MYHRLRPQISSEERWLHHCNSAAERMFPQYLYFRRFCIHTAVFFVVDLCIFYVNVYFIFERKIGVSGFHSSLFKNISSWTGLLRLWLNMVL